MTATHALAGEIAYAGVDTHKDTNMLGLKDALGRTIGTREFPAGPAGYEALARAIGDASVPVAVEGARSYGAGLAAFLSAGGFRVYEAVRPARQRRRGGKSDAADALAACDALAAGRCIPAKRLDGGLEALRCLMVAREHAVGQMTALSNAVDSMLVTAPAEVRERWRGVSGEARMRGIARTRPGDDAGFALRMMARRWASLSEEAGELERRMSPLVSAAFPALVGADCVGVIVASRIVLAAGSNPERMSSEAAFSMLAGTSPIPASSGRTDRHRLNRGGDRQLNRAIHEIARARMSHDRRTREYVRRKMSEGKSKKEAVRCLCRYIAREVYRLLTGPQEIPCEQGGLAGRRREVGLTQGDVAEGAGITRSKVSRLERLEEFDAEALARYDAFLRRMENPGIAS